MTSEALIALLDRLGIANAQMRDMFEFADHPQLAARDRWRTVGLPGGSTMRALVPPVSIAGVEWAMGDVPALGQHTTRVLAELDLDAEDREAEA